MPASASSPWASAARPGRRSTSNGFKVHTQLDATTLQQISDTTGGTYFGAEDDAGLAKVYDEVDTKLVVKPQQIEVTALFAGASRLLLALGGLTSLAWLGRLP